MTKQPLTMAELKALKPGTLIYSYYEDQKWVDEVARNARWYATITGDVPEGYETAGIVNCPSSIEVYLTVAFLSQKDLEDYLVTQYSFEELLLKFGTETEKSVVNLIRGEGLEAVDAAVRKVLEARG